MRIRFLVLATAALAVAALTPAAADAHDLQLTVKLLPDGVRLEAGYDDDTPAEDAKVTITDAGGSVVAEGRTDERGVCRFPTLKPGKYTAAVAALGHGDEVEFEVGGSDEEFAGSRFPKALGLALGVGGLLTASAAFWWLRRRTGPPADSAAW